MAQVGTEIERHMHELSKTWPLIVSRIGPGHTSDCILDLLHMPTSSTVSAHTGLAAGEMGNQTGHLKT